MKKALYLLAQLSDRDFEWLLTAGRRLAVPSGRSLIQEGQPTDALYIILDGTLAVCVEAFGGETIAELSSGEVIGEMSFVDSRPPSATVKAMADSTVWSIPRLKLNAKLMHDVEFAAHFYHAVAVFLSDRLRDTVSRLGYTKNNTLDEDEDLNPQVISNLELAKARLDWLLNRLKEAP
ncbi:cyclic nucleotide-binding protein [filamentous cyanobacterium CCP1]|nr:cyclic nucleotide-binding protein [filamentous cyanobacterium CCP2]PSB64619.1 cyclic nucleotide-binding protein [filamentous cyanobacterium CCP1]